uniref:Uncharacterized protein n=1 Tax=Setaria viridis TaxID=4556 RepID=A0A4U6VUU6_SETVI|nr:hypothetical protein SEVIR_2G173450v2 [Setaria viridis]
MPPTLGRLPTLRRRPPCHPASCACQSACSDAGTPASCSQSLSLRSAVCSICGRPTVCHRPGPVRRPAGHTWRRFVDVHAASLFSAPFHYDAGVRAVLPQPPCRRSWRQLEACVSFVCAKSCSLRPTIRSKK